MPQILYRGEPVALEPGEDVLSALLRAEIDAPHSCRAGCCQSCMHRAIGGKPPSASQEGLSEAQIALGYFLPCICVPENDLSITPIDDKNDRYEAEVYKIDFMARDIVRLYLDHDPGFKYRSGQFLELIAKENLSRHYSIASFKETDAYLELHIKIHDNGAMSHFITNKLKVGTKLKIAGPLGTCIYEGTDLNQPMVLLGAGTGLSPLEGIRREAFHRQHLGPIRLYHGARTKEGLYSHAYLDKLAKAHKNFEYFSSYQDSFIEDQRDIAKILLNKEKNLSETMFFLCGGAGLVNRLKKDLFMNGVSLKNIRSDVFTPAKDSLAKTP